MGKTSFKEFVEQEREADFRIRSIDWAGKKEAYIEQVKALFNDIKKFLREFIESNDVQIETTFEEIEEENIAAYLAPALRIRLYGKQADLIPRGTNMIGTPGRVDLVGNIETKKIMLVDKYANHFPFGSAITLSELEERKNCQECNYVWKIVTEPPHIRYIELNEDSFLSALQEVLDG